MKGLFTLTDEVSQNDSRLFAGKILTMSMNFPFGINIILASNTDKRYSLFKICLLGRTPLIFISPKSGQM